MYETQNMQETCIKDRRYRPHDSISVIFLGGWTGEDTATGREEFTVEDRRGYAMTLGKHNLV